MQSVVCAKLVYGGFGLNISVQFKWLIVGTSDTAALRADVAPLERSWAAHSRHFFKIYRCPVGFLSALRPTFKLSSYKLYQCNQKVSSVLP